MCSRNNKNNYSAYEGYGTNMGYRDGYGNITEAYGNFPYVVSEQRDGPMLRGGGGYGGGKMRSNYGGIKGGYGGGGMQGMIQGMQNRGSGITRITRDMVNNDGTLKPMRTPYVFVMIKSANCGYCQMATPEFQLLASVLGGNPQLTLATLQADEERDLYTMLSKIFGFQGVPAYLLFKNGKVIAEYSGDRSQRHMSSWLGQNMR